MTLTDASLTTEQLNDILVKAEAAIEDQKCRRMKPYWFTVKELTNGDDHTVFFKLDASHIAASKPTAIHSMASELKRLREAMKGILEDTHRIVSIDELKDILSNLEGAHSLAKIGNSITAVSAMIESKPI